MKIQEINQEITETHKKLNGLKYKLIEAQQEEDERLINTIPSCFSLKQCDANHGRETWWVLHLHGKPILSSDFDESNHAAKVNLAKRAHEYWKYALMIFPDKVQCQQINDI